MKYEIKMLKLREDLKRAISNYAKFHYPDIDFKKLKFESDLIAYEVARTVCDSQSCLTIMSVLHCMPDESEESK